MSTPKLSLILPAYKSAALLKRALPALLAYLAGLDETFEVLVVDDGSNDAGETQKVVEGLGCRFLANPSNQGKGAALRLGMLAAEGQFRIFTDADIPYELETIERFLWYLDFKEFHMVVGDRTLPNSHYYTDIPAGRQVVSKIFSFIVGRFIVGGWFDTQCGIKGFRAEVAEDIFGVARVDRFATDVEQLYIALKRNYDIKRLPVRLRVWEQSQIKMVQDSLNMVISLFSILVNFYRGRYAPRGPVASSLDTYPQDIEQA